MPERPRPSAMLRAHSAPMKRTRVEIGQEGREAGPTVADG